MHPTVPRGEFTVDSAQYRFVLTHNHTFTGDNFSKVFGSEHNASPDAWKANPILSCRHKLGQPFGFVTQVNVAKSFNHYVFGTLPNNGSGYTVPANLAMSFYGQPRLYVWTNTLSF